MLNLKKRITSMASKLNIAERNLIANFAGQFVSALLGVILVPLYLHMVGVEGYGLIGFYSTLWAVLVTLDFGMSITINREIAMKRTQKEFYNSLRDLAFTMQIIFIVAGIMVALLMIASSEWIANRWLIVEDITSLELKNAIILMAISIGVRWSVPFYQGILRGLETHVELNIIMIATAIFRALGAIYVLTCISNSVVAFFMWQLIATIVEVSILGWASWKHLRPIENKKAKWNFSLFRKIIKFALLVAGADFLKVVFKQSDKIFITKLLPLNEMGFYSVATVLSSLILFAVAPISYTFYPRFSNLIAAQRNDDLRSLYHSSSQLVAAISCPAAAFFIFFSHDLLMLGTRSIEVADASAIALSLLSFGFLMHALMQMPRMLQMAANLPKIDFYASLMGTVFCLPAIYFYVKRYGINGAAFVWAMYHLIYFLVIPWVMHRHVLLGQLGKWFWQDTVIYLAIGFGVSYLFYLMRLKFHFQGSTVIFMGSSLLVSYAIALCFWPPMKQYYKKLMKWIEENANV